MLNAYKNAQTLYQERITGALTDRITGNQERVIITVVYIHGNMDLLVAKIDDNNGIDITLEGTASNFDFVDQFPEYMA